MATKYPCLNSPMVVNGVFFKNRIMCGPGAPTFAQSAEPYPSDGWVDYYLRKARGGASAVVGQGIAAEIHLSDDPIQSHMPRINGSDGAVQHRYAEVAEGIIAEGSVPFMQCMPPMELVAGYDVSEGVLSEYVEGDGSFPMTGKEAPRELLYKVAEEYGKTAALAKELGYKGVQLHMAYRNMFPGRFLSRYTNKRTDEFGGSLENRARFPLMICDEIKRQAGKDMIVSVAITAVEPPEIYGEDGLTIEETKEFVKMANGHIDIISVREHQIDMAQGVYFLGTSTPNRYAHHEFAQVIRDNHLNIKLAYVCGGHDLDECEDMVRSGDTDFILTTRAFMSNPNFGLLMQEGRGDDVVPCLRCNKCHQARPLKWATFCSVNPEHALEHRLDHMVTPPGPSKKIAIIGGGCVGMKAAMDLYDRGHSVTIFEKEDRLGGQLNLASVPDFKWTQRKFRDYLVYQVGKRGIEVVFNHEVKDGELEGKYDRIIVALGAEPIRPAIPGADVCITYKDVLEHPELAKGDVVIIGGGEIGMETGLWLAKNGHKTCVIEMQDKLAPEIPPIHFRRAYREMVWEKTDGYSWELNAKVTKIEDGKVFYEQGGEIKEIAADTVILAVGSKSLDFLTVGSCSNDLYTVLGDCVKPASIAEAMRAAHFAACNI